MRYRFGHYTLDLQRQELRHADRLIPLRAKTFQLLSYLIAQYERVVPKDELLEYIWSGQFIGDATLNSCLKDVRQAVGDDGRSQNVIQTLRGRGYRFVAAVEIDPPKSEQIASEPDRATADAPPAWPASDTCERGSSSLSCPACQYPLSLGARFCMACGAALEKRCVACQHAAPLAAAFCPGCGAALARSNQAESDPLDREASPDTQASSTLSQSHRQVTVLCCAVPGAFDLVRELGPEPMHELMHRLLTRAQDIVQGYEGTLTQWNSDGFTALFGAHPAAEDHARRAVLAAVDLHRAFEPPVALSSSAAGTTLAISIGVHTGPVVIGNLDQLPHRPYTATGTTTHFASQLQQLAPPGVLLASAATYQPLQAEIRVAPWFPPSEVNLVLPLDIYRVQGVLQRRSGVSGYGERYTSRFVGRQRELEMLYERFDQAMGGQGQVVSITGEPGMGKSRLLTEFRHRLGPQLAASYLGRCLSYGASTPYLPVASLLRDICSIQDTDVTATIRGKARQRLEHVNMYSDEWMPYLYALLGLDEGAEMITHLSPATVQQRTFQALRHLLLTLSDQHPLLIAMEDLHWIDPTSQECLSALVDRLAGARVLFLGTYRPGYRPPWLEKSYVSQLALQPLTAREGRQLIQSLPTAQAMTEPVVSTLLEKAEGNPFFLEELACTAITQAEPREQIGAPDTVQSVIMARLDQLPEQSKHFVQIASVVGREVPQRLMQFLWDGPGAVDDHLTMLQRLEFLYEQVGHHEPVYCFQHALTQDVAYGSLLQSRRAALHLTVGHALEALYADHLDDVLDQLAHHYGRSRDADKAVSYLMQMGAKSAQRHAHTEAVSAYQQALEHVEGLLAPERDRRRLEVILQLAFSFALLGRFRETLDLLTPQQGLVDQLQEPMLTGPYYFRLGLTSLYLGATERAIQCGQHALSAAQQCQDQLTMGRVYHLLSWAYETSGDYHQGLFNGQKAVALLKSLGDWHYLGLVYMHLGRNANYLSQFDTALEALTQAQRLGQHHADPRLQYMTEYYLAEGYNMVGEWEQAIEICELCLNASPDPITTAAALMHLGNATFELGHFNQAILRLEQSVDQFARLQLRYAQGRAAAHLAEALLADGQAERAAPFAQDGLDLCTEAKHFYGVGLAHRALGRIAMAQAALTSAVKHFQNAMQTFTAIDVQSEVARTHLAWAALAQTQGHHHEVVAHLRTAHDLFTSLQIPKYVERAEYLARTYHIALVPR